MRFLDFLEDLRDTSSRISQRDAYVYRHDPELIAHLTLKTLLRRDTGQYFDSLLADASLSPIKRLIGYIFFYAFIVNATPRPTDEQLSQLGHILAGRLRKCDPLRDYIQMPELSRLSMSAIMTKNINHIIRRKYATDPQLYYTSKKIDSLLKSHKRSSPKGALLLIGPNINLTPECDNARLVYSGVVFKSEALTLYGHYWGAQL